MVDKKKATAAAAVAAIITSSSAAIEANFDDPAEILQNSYVEPQVQHIDADTDELATDDQDSDKQKEKAAKGTFKGFILDLPWAIRLVFVLPLWFIGNAVVFAGGLLFSAASPVLNVILGFVLLALVIAAAFTFTAKAMFPDLPLKKILNKHSIKWILIASAVVYAADLILGITWAGYAHFKTIIMGCLTLAALTCILIWFARREHRRRARLEEKERQKLENAHSDELVYESLGEQFVIRK